MSTTTSNLVFSDLYNLKKIVKNTAALAGKNLIIDVLREAFSEDREYKYVGDIYGFPKTPDHTGLEPNAGYTDEKTTRIFIGGTYRHDVSFLPAVTVRNTSISYKPISFNQNRWNTVYGVRKLVDGYGNTRHLRVPTHYTYSGAWDQSFEIKVSSNSLEETVEIGELVMLLLQNIYRDILQQKGLFIKTVRSGGEAVESINANSPIYTMSISADTYSEWYRKIPISNLVERVQLCMNFDLYDEDVPANDLSINMKF